MPRIFFLRDALVERDESLAEAKLPCSTLDEIEGYVWPKGQDGKSVKEVPMDRDNHGMDAMRYACAYVDGLGGAGAATWGTDPLGDDWT
jgi:hypothetical protein